MKKKFEAFVVVVCLIIWVLVAVWFIGFFNYYQAKQRVQIEIDLPVIIEREYISDELLYQSIIYPYLSDDNPIINL